MLHVFSDFDGTITRIDTLQVLISRLGAGMDDDVRESLSGRYPCQTHV